MALSGNEILQVLGVQSNGQPTSVTQQTTTGAIAALAALESTTPTNTNITTVGNGTLTAASIVGQLINRSGPTSNFTDTTDTAANIIAALPAGVVVNDAFVFYYVNTTVYQSTIAAGIGVTLAGLSPIIPANSTAEILVTYTGTGAVTLRVIESLYNNAGGYDPSTVLTQFGSSTATFGEEGNVYKLFSGGTSPASTGSDIVVATYTLPVNAFDASGRSLTFMAAGNFANNANSKTVKIIVGATSATVGSAVVGGTTIGSLTYSTASAVGWSIVSNLSKYGAAGSNTQNYQNMAIIAGSTHSGMGQATALTLTESSPIICAITINCATTATDASLWQFEINATN